MQNVNFFTKHVIANLPKFTISVQNQTNEGLFINYDYAALKSQLVTFSYEIFKLRDKNDNKQKLEIWKLMHSCLRCLNLWLHMIKILKVYAHWDKDNTESKSSIFYTATPSSTQWNFFVGKGI